MRNPRALAPSCVVVSTRKSYIDVHNYCQREHRVKVIVAWGFDSPCHYLRRGQGFSHEHHTGHFDRLVLC
jgi:hypothetical protein